jgi:hypothetical protein
MGKGIGIGVLDWGLGHACRMIPIVDELVALGHVPVFLTSGDSGRFLRERYPGEEHHDIPSLRIQYGRHAFLSVLAQTKKLIRAEKEENHWIKQHFDSLSLDGIISDNRYGLHDSRVPSVLITHQLSPEAGVLSFFSDMFIAKRLEKFDEIWIPDLDGESSLAGRMTENRFFKGKKVFIGWLSRFLGLKISVESFLTYDNLGLVSGPENARTSFQEELTTRFKTSGLPSLIVCGLPGTPFDRMDGNVRLVNHLPDEAFAGAILTAGKIVARSGYSTMMDLAALGHTADWIPTPGQTEQMYLARRNNSGRNLNRAEEGDFKIALGEFLQRL